MNKLIFTLNVLILLSILPAQGMKKEKQSTLQINAQDNSDCPLPNLKEDQLIFACCLMQPINPQKSPMESQKALKGTIKNFINMRSSCKKYYEFLTYKHIGISCKNHSSFAKNSLLHQFTPASIINYRHRHPILILIYADAKINEDKKAPLLEISIKYNDIYLLTALLEHKVKPNDNKNYGDPLIFSVKTVEIAQILMDKGVNIHASRNTGYNFLSDLLRKNQKRSQKLIETITHFREDGSQFTIKNFKIETEYIRPTYQSTWDLIEFCLKNNVFMSDEDRELYNKFTSQLSTTKNITNDNSINLESVSQEETAVNEEADDVIICTLF